MCSSLLADMQIDWNWQIIEFVADKSCFGHGDPPLNTPANSQSNYISIMCRRKRGIHEKAHIVRGNGTFLSTFVNGDH